MNIGDTQIFRYVPFHLVRAYEALGWQVTTILLGTPHGEYSVALQWLGNGEPVEPNA